MPKPKLKRLKNKPAKKENLNQLKGSWTVAEIEIIYKPIITNRAVVSSSNHAYELIKQLWDNEKINLLRPSLFEEFNVPKKILPGS